MPSTALRVHDPIAPRRVAASLLVAALVVSSTGLGQAARDGIHPADPNAPVPPLRYASPFSGYRTTAETTLLPWRGLFDARGEFASPPASGVGADLIIRKPAGGHIDHDRSGRTVTLAAVAAPPPGSDTRARIESINRADGKVKLKHGPIPKLDMPAMTMVFRVADAALLDQISEGDEVGVTVEKVGSAYVVIGIQR